MKGEKCHLLNQFQLWHHQTLDVFSDIFLETQIM